MAYLSLFLTSFLAATILPLGSEPVLLSLHYLGYDSVSLITVATLGNTLGGMTSYGLGYLGKWEWVEKWLKIKRGKIKSYQSRLEKYGVWMALLTWLPIVGDPIAIALGFFRLSPWKVLVLMMIGKLARYCLIIYMAESI